jgi:DNA-binding beta-propeller fold protein YncE
MGVGLTRDGANAFRGVHGGWRASLAALGTVVVALALSCSPAVALTQRGHVFGYSFGEAAAKAELSSPVGIAVDEASHEVYVVDRAKNRVDRFACGGPATEPCTFVKSFEVPSPESIAVDNSSDESQGDVYVASSVRVPAAEVFKGTVFKFTKEGTQITKLTKVAGEPLGKVNGLAVTPNGELWIEQGEQGNIDRFTGGLPNKFIAEPEPFEVVSELREGSFIAPGFAVDSGGEHLYVSHGEVEAELELEVHKEVNTEELKEANCAKGPCTVAKLSVQQELENGELSDSVADLSPELLPEASSGVAVDLTGEGSFANDVYLDSGKSIVALDAEGKLIQRFGSEEGAFKGLQEGSGVAVDSLTGEVFVVDAGAKTVDVFVREGKGQPKIEEVSASKVTSRSAQLNAVIDPGDNETTYTFQYGTTVPVNCAEPPSATCEAPIPAASLGAGFTNQPASVALTNLQPGTQYHFLVIASQAGGVKVDSEEGTFTTSGAAGEAFLPDDRQWELVSPADASGAAVEPIRLEGGAIQAAANGEAISYVTDAPIEGRPKEEPPEGNRNPEITQVLSTRKPGGGWSSQDIVTPNETSENLGLVVNEYRLFSKNLSLSLVFPFPGEKEVGALAQPPLAPPVEANEEQEKTPYLRADGPTPPLAPEPETAEESNSLAYGVAQQNGKTMGNAGYLALLTHQDDTTAVGFGSPTTKVSIRGATPDLSHVVLSAVVPLLSSAPPSSRELYEWHEEDSSEGGHEGKLQLVNELPDGKLSTGRTEVGEVGGLNVANNTRHAISNNGLRVFWSSVLLEGSEPDESTEPHLYMRDTAKEQTIRLDQPKAGVHKQVENAAFTGEAKFMAASADGSTVLFTDSRPLTEESGAEEALQPEERKADLYECEISETAGQDSCALSDLTPRQGGEQARVLGTTLGSTETDASRVYFVANGVLTSAANSEGEKATPGGCPNHNEGAALIQPLGATCNLYLSTREAPGVFKTTFIARISDLDSPDFEASKGDLGRLTARVSPNGRYLAFMSERSLTGYDNRDVNSDQPDEEVYIYDAQANRLVCASCNPSGQRPLGVFDQSLGSNEGQGLFVDRPEIWANAQVDDDPWLAGSVPGWDTQTRESAMYQDRYLLDDGRLYFNSSDALVPQDTNGKEDVYEYEPPEIGNCTEASPTFSSKSNGCISLISSGTSEQESDFLDASESGSDVFFLTSAQLVKGAEANFSVYDAHVCESNCPAPAPPPAAPCHGEECHGAPPTSPTFAAPSSTTFSGSGNVVPAQQALPFTSVKKPLTRAQLLAAALKSCKKKHNEKKRVACERQARKRYGSKSAKKARSSKRSGSAKGGSR